MVKWRWKAEDAVASTTGLSLSPRILDKYCSKTASSRIDSSKSEAFSGIALDLSMYLEYWIDTIYCSRFSAAVGNPLVLACSFKAQKVVSWHAMKLREFGVAVCLPPSGLVDIHLQDLELHYICARSLRVAYALDLGVYQVRSIGYIVKLATTRNQEIAAAHWITISWYPVRYPKKY